MRTYKGYIIKYSPITNPNHPDMGIRWRAGKVEMGIAFNIKYQAKTLQELKKLITEGGD